jgi:hypothetical protein
VKLSSPKMLVAIAVLVACSFLAGGQLLNGADNDSAASTTEAIRQARIGYVQALVDHAKASLDAIRTVNKRGAGEIANSSIRPYESDLALAELRLKTLQENKMNSGEDYVACLKASLDSAEASLKKLQDINAKVPNTVPAIQLTQTQSDANLARARLKVAEVAMKGSEMERIEAQMIGMQDDIRELKRQVELLQSRN